MDIFLHNTSFFFSHIGRGRGEWGEKSSEDRGRDGGNALGKGHRKKEQAFANQQTENDKGG